MPKPSAHGASWKWASGQSGAERHARLAQPARHVAADGVPVAQDTRHELTEYKNTFTKWTRVTKRSGVHKEVRHGHGECGLSALAHSVTTSMSATCG